MPTFAYTAKSISGQIKAGSQQAASEAELARLLREEGFFLTSCKDSSIAHQKFSLQNIQKIFLLAGRVPLMEKILFAQHLAVMIGAGLPLSKALETLILQTKNKKFSAIIKNISESIRAGVSFADALGRHQKIFPEIFINMVKVGETSGNLEEVLKTLADQMKKDYELRSRVKGAMIYPSVIIVAMIGIGALMMVTIVPKLSAIFKELKIDLPLTTKIIIAISDFMAAHWALGILAIIILIFGVRFLLRAKLGKEKFDWLLLRAPVFGEIIKKINSARFARTLGSMIKSSVPITQGLKIVAGTLGNSLFRQSLLETAEQIQKGQALNEGLKKYPNIYPPMVSQMIEVGEQTGTLDEILTRLAEFYEEDIANVTKGLSTIIEPILMIIIGAAVGFFAVSMLQPMYSMMDAI